MRSEERTWEHPPGADRRTIREQPASEQNREVSLTDIIHSMLDRTSPSDDRLAGGPLPASGVRAARGPTPSPAPIATSAADSHSELPASGENGPVGDVTNDPVGPVTNDPGGPGDEVAELGLTEKPWAGLRCIHTWTARLEGWGAGRWLAALRWVRKGLVLALGASVVLVGVVMLITPGPAFLVIPAGLAILATEFYWARRLLRWLRTRASQALHQQMPNTPPPNTPPPNNQPTNPQPLRRPPGCDALPAAAPTTTGPVEAAPPRSPRDIPGEPAPGDGSQRHGQE
jgi:hypothetical protein